MIGIGEYQYFIPISSAKEKHIKWKNVSDAHLLIYELVDNNLNIQSHVYKPYDNRQKVHVLSVLDIKKMLPVPDGAYNFIDFDELKDEKYRDLFEKEYNFCLRIREKILYKAEKLYNKQMEAKIVRNMYCDFKKLENVLLE